MSEDIVEAAHHNHIIQVGPEGCSEVVPFMEFTGFGKAYVPNQELCQIYSANVGFVRGTIFPELDMPYQPKSMRKCEGGGCAHG